MLIKNKFLKLLIVNFLINDSDKEEDNSENNNIEENNKNNNNNEENKLSDISQKPLFSYLENMKINIKRRNSIDIANAEGVSKLYFLFHNVIEFMNSNNHFNNILSKYIIYSSLK